MIVDAAATTGRAALATGSTPAGAAIQAAAAGSAPLLMRLGQKISEWRMRRRQKWLEASVEGPTPDDVVRRVAVLEEHAEEEWVKHVVLESIRRVDESVADAVIPALGRLSQEYLDAEKRPDQFFRALSRTLTDLSAAEFGSLCGMITAALASTVDRPFYFIVFEEDRVTLVRKHNPSRMTTPNNGRQLAGSRGRGT